MRAREPLARVPMRLSFPFVMWLRPQRDQAPAVFQKESPSCLAAEGRLSWTFELLLGAFREPPFWGREAAVSSVASATSLGPECRHEINHRARALKVDGHADEHRTVPYRPKAATVAFDVKTWISHFKAWRTVRAIRQYVASALELCGQTFGQTPALGRHCLHREPPCDVPG